MSGPTRLRVEFQIKTRPRVVLVPSGSQNKYRHQDIVEVGQERGRQRKVCVDSNKMGIIYPALHRTTVNIMEEDGCLFSPYSPLTNF